MAVRTQMRGPVLEVTLDRPEARNAFDQATIRELRELFEGISYLEPPSGQGPLAGGATGGAASHAAGAKAGPAGATRPHAILLRATGPVFCAGADLGDMEELGQAGFQDNLEAAREMGAMFRAVRLCPAPVVARVQGPAYGGGVGLICACDVAVAGQEARFAFSEVRLGLVAGVIAPLVMDRIGAAAARHWFLTGDAIRAVDALRLGLVDRLSDQEGLDAAVGRTLGSLLKGGPAALGRIKSLVEGTLALGFERSLDFTARMIAEARTGQEAQAGLRAFFGKQDAPWVRDFRWPPEEGDA